MESLTWKCTVTKCVTFTRNNSIIKYTLFFYIIFYTAESSKTCKLTCEARIEKRLLSDYFSAGTCVLIYVQTRTYYLFYISRISCTYPVISLFAFPLRAHVRDIKIQFLNFACFYSVRQKKKRKQSRALPQVTKINVSFVLFAQLIVYINGILRKPLSRRCISPRVERKNPLYFSANLRRRELPRIGVNPASCARRRRRLRRESLYPKR